MHKTISKRRVSEAVRELAAQAQRSPARTLVQLAGDRAEAFLAKGDGSEARFWNNVHSFLIMNDSLDGKMEFPDEDNEAK